MLSASPFCTSRPRPHIPSHLLAHRPLYPSWYPVHQCFLPCNHSPEQVSTETEEMRFNTAIAAMMEFVNGVTKSWTNRPRKALEVGERRGGERRWEREGRGEGEGRRGKQGVGGGCCFAPVPSG